MNSSVDVHIGNLTSAWPYTLQDFHTELTIWFAVILTLALAGSLNSLTLLMVILCRRVSRQGSNLLIANLIFTNLLIAAVFIPINIAVTFGQYYHFHLSVRACRSYATVGSIVFTCGNWTDACLAVNRFIAICYPGRYMQWRRRWVVLTMVTFTWLATTAMVVPMQVFGIGTSQRESVTEQCTFAVRGVLGNFLLALVTFVPYGIVGVVSVVVLVYTLTQRYVAAREVAVMPAGRLCNAGQAQRNQRRMRVGRMLLISFLWCCLCNLPPLVLTTGYPQLFTRLPTLNIWMKICFYMQYAVNPVIFFAMSQDYRKGLHAFLGTVRRKIISRHCAC